MNDLSEFLLTAGPNQMVELPRVSTVANYGGGKAISLSAPDRLEMYCGACRGFRGFQAQESQFLVYVNRNTDVFLDYVCKDCGREWKTFAVSAIALESGAFRITKFGERPPYGPKYDPNVGTLLGNDAHLYRKGLDCEAAGMGIGAFAYYRRVLENQRSALFERVIAVAKKLKGPDDLIQGLEKAKGDRQFTKAIESIKAGPLHAIYINGHNPLSLLYDAVSDGLHAQSDEENMQTAQTIRLLLANLALRLDEVLADHQEVEGAVNRLLKAQADRKTRQQAKTPGGNAEPTEQ